MITKETLIKLLEQHDLPVSLADSVDFDAMNIDIQEQLDIVLSVYKKVEGYSFVKRMFSTERTIAKENYRNALTEIANKYLCDIPEVYIEDSETLSVATDQPQPQFKRKTFAQELQDEAEAEVLFSSGRYGVIDPYTGKRVPVAELKKKYAI